MTAFTPPRSTDQLINAAADGGQVPSKIRRSLELVRACNQDLQHLIHLRNEHLPVLQTKPRDLERVNSVIGEANNGLAEACRIVERFRPEAHPRSKMPLRRRLAWILGDSLEFQSQLPVVSRHHATVLAELNYVRQLALWTASAEGKDGESGTGTDNGADQYGNHLLLGDLIGDNVSVSSQTSFSTRRPVSTCTLFNSPKHPVEYCDLPEAVFPNTIPDQVPTSKGLSSATWRLSDYRSSKASVSSLGSVDASDLSILFDGQSQPPHELDSIQQHRQTNTPSTCTKASSLSLEAYRSTVSLLSTDPGSDAPERVESIRPYNGRASKCDVDIPKWNDASCLYDGSNSQKPSTKNTTASLENSRPLPPQRRRTEYEQVDVPPYMVPGASSQPAMQIAERSCKRNKTWPRFVPYGSGYALPEQSSTAKDAESQAVSQHVDDKKE
ncbi:hypothetical protein XA68_13387 [Ophiocordyceps unilateralis]|uniref:Uncharacterized protein n=1 Tax=Ophiocordyceps unilateralis TaxID=268505 RepID=A0A2A9PLW8_OPHUN|nr:hypothetical protein XA68_13387 [Ophiocordyceps unilateralis]